MAAINNWLVACFFGATVGFAVPVKELLNINAFLKGIVVGIGAVLGKIIAGVFRPKRWVIGWAMVGRGEFSFLVGDIYKSTEFKDSGEMFLSQEGFAIVVWGLLVAIFVAPLGFGYVLNLHLKRDGLNSKDVQPKPEEKDKDGRPRRRSSSMFQIPQAVMFEKHEDVPRSDWKVRVRTKYQPKLAIDILRIFSENKIHVKSYFNQGDLENSELEFLISLPDPSLVEAKMEKQKSEEEEFFSFDIDLFMQRLKTTIEKQMNSGGTTEAVSIIRVMDENESKQSTTVLAIGNDFHSQL